MSDDQGSSGFSPQPPPPPPLPAPSAGPGAGGDRTGPPWESGLAFPQSYIDTVRGVLLDPNTFFAAMRREGGLQAPLIFALIGLVGVTIIRALLSAMLPFSSLGGTMSFGASFIVMPVILTLALFIASGIYHFILQMLGGPLQPYETTFRVVAYGWGSTYLVSIVPICGGIVSAVWTLVVLVIGLSKAHDTSQNNALIAVLVPTVVCCVIGVAVAVMFGLGLAALIAGASGGMGDWAR